MIVIRSCDDAVVVLIVSAWSEGRQQAVWKGVSESDVS